MHRSGQHLASLVLASTMRHPCCFLLLFALLGGSPSEGTTPPPECGTRSYTMPLVAGGQDAVEGQVPWHAGIYRSKNGSFQLICGGTLISPRFVVSAAHCFYNEGKRKVEAPGSFRVALGKTSRGWDEGAKFVTTQRLLVDTIRVPTFFYGSKSHFSHDIALLRLASDAHLSDTVSYACVDWDAEQRDWTSLPEASKGLVAGFGATSASTASDILQWTTMPIVPIDQCAEILRQTNEAHKLTADRLCVGYVGKGVGVCRGDSGGGLVSLNAITERFFLRGVVSITLSGEPLQSGQTCKSQHLSGFTDISHHISFLKRFVAADQRPLAHEGFATDETRPAGYERVGNHGYFKAHEELRNWAQGKAACHAEGGYLLILRSVEEHTELKKRYGPRMKHGPYYGGHHRNENQKFVTIYDEPISESGFAVWERGYPGHFANNEYPVLRVEMTNSSTGLAVEKDWEHRPFICKWTPRPPGYERLEDFGFFKAHEELKTWAEAVATCRRERAYLLILRSVEEYVAVKRKYAAKMRHGPYYGAHHRNRNQNFVTIFNEPLIRTNYTVWQTGYPGNFRNDMYPVLRLEMSDSATGLAVEKDNEHRPFICKYDLP